MNVDTLWGVAVIRSVDDDERLRARSRLAFAGWDAADIFDSTRLPNEAAGCEFMPQWREVIGRLREHLPDRDAYLLLRRLPNVGCGFRRFLEFSFSTLQPRGVIALTSDASSSSGTVASHERPSLQPRGLPFGYVMSRKCFAAVAADAAGISEGQHTLGLHGLIRGVCRNTKQAYYELPVTRDESVRDDRTQQRGDLAKRGQSSSRTPGLAVVACHFNPCGFAAPRQNLLEFIDGIESSSVDLYIAELAFEGQDFFLEPTPRTLQLRTDSVLWQKERLLNLLISRLPADIDKVAWVDADLLFRRHCWPQLAVEALGQWSVVQLFDRAVWLDQDRQPLQTRLGIAYGTQSRGIRAFPKLHPGFAWAARREVLEKCGLYDRLITGGGDAVIARGLFRQFDQGYLQIFNDNMRRDIVRWWREIDEQVCGKVGYIKSSVMHLWHGDHICRRYLDRKQCLREDGFDPDVDIAIDQSGCWKWATDKPGLHDAIRNYFVGRNEDQSVVRF